MTTLKPRTKLLALTTVGTVFTALLLLFPSPNIPKAHAYTTECPANYSDSECLEYLKEQATNVSKEIGNLQENLDNEQYEQLGLYEQISYKQNLIAQKEAEIDELEIEINKNNLEISILLREIEVLQNSIDIASQEIERLKNSVQDRIRQTYKYSRVSPIEIMLSSEDYDSLTRRIEYLQKTRDKDMQLLEDMSGQMAQLNHEQQTLAIKKISVQDKRDEVEETKSAVFKEKQAMDGERATLQTLLAESERREQQYLGQLDSNRLVQGALDEKISKILASMLEDQEFAHGQYVPAGGVVGYMGSTGCSTGAHLHFSINGGTKYSGWGYFWGDVSPWAGYLVKGPDYAWIGGGGWKYYYVHSGAFVLPVKAPVVLTQDFHQGKSIDLVSLQGAGAPVYAAHSGMLLKGAESVCGGKYAMVQASDGTVTIYLHIQ